MAGLRFYGNYNLTGTGEPERANVLRLSPSNLMSYAWRARRPTWSHRSNRRTTIIRNRGWDSSEMVLSATGDLGGDHNSHRQNDIPSTKPPTYTVVGCDARGFQVSGATSDLGFLGKDRNAVSMSLISQVSRERPGVDETRMLTSLNVVARLKHRRRHWRKLNTDMSAFAREDLNTKFTQDKRWTGEFQRDLSSHPRHTVGNV
jgi:hypothetical protein